MIFRHRTLHPHGICGLWFHIKSAFTVSVIREEKKCSCNRSSHTEKRVIGLNVRVFSLSLGWSNRVPKSPTVKVNHYRVKQNEIWLLVELM